MKKKIISMVAISMVSSLVLAQKVEVLEEHKTDVTVCAEAGLYSAYVWRGQILNNNPVAQPSVTAAKGPLSLNIWGNWNINDNDGRDDAGEIDYTAAYTLPFSTDDITVDVGMIYYTYPGSGNEAKSTEEVFVKSTFNNIILTPVASAYYDIDEINGWYGNLACSQGVEISDAMSAEIGASVGYGTRNYNLAVEDNGSGAVNDYNVYVSTDYALTEKLSLGALLQYTRLDGGVGNDVAGAQNNDILWGGVTLSCKFL